MHLSLLFLLLAILCPTLSFGASPSFATGIKIGEVTPNSALIWARLASVETADSQSKKSVAPGSPGAVRLRYWPEGEADRRTELPGTPVSADRDHTCQIPLTGLTPNTTYLLEAIAYSVTGVESARVKGGFKTPPAADTVSDVSAVLVTCQGHETIDDPIAGHWVYQHMLTHDPDFFVHTGDVVYYDKAIAYPASKTVAAARERWNRMFAYTWNRDFHTRVSSYFMKDDHDTLKNDCWPGQTYGDLTWEQGLKVWAEQIPQSEKPYRTFRWGKNLQVWFPENRMHRSDNAMEDGPEKTIWGKEQKAWLKRTLLESVATFAGSRLIAPEQQAVDDRQHQSDRPERDSSTLDRTSIGKRLRREIEHQLSIGHQAITCTDTGADRTEEVTPAAGNTYYLVVPVGATSEGSYGIDHSGERPQGSPGTCTALPQSFSPCP